MSLFLERIRQVDALIAAFERHPDDAVRAQVAELLVGLDGMHREALGRLVAALRERGAGDMLDEIADGDRAVEIILGLYDLVPLELPAEEGAPPSDAPVTGFVPVESLTFRRPSGG